MGEETTLINGELNDASSGESWWGELLLFSKADRKALDLHRLTSAEFLLRAGPGKSLMEWWVGSDAKVNDTCDLADGPLTPVAYMLEQCSAQLVPGTWECPAKFQPRPGKDIFRLKETSMNKGLIPRWARLWIRPSVRLCYRDFIQWL